VWLERSDSKSIILPFYITNDLPFVASSSPRTSQMLMDTSSPVTPILGIKMKMNLKPILKMLKEANNYVPPNEVVNALMNTVPKSLGKVTEGWSEATPKALYRLPTQSGWGEVTAALRSEATMNDIPYRPFSRNSFSSSLPSSHISPTTITNNLPLIADPRLVL